MFIHLKNISQIGSFPQVGGKWSKIVETTQDERQGTVWKNNKNDWCRSRGNKSAIDKLDGFFAFPIAAKESRFFLRHWHFHCGFGHQAHVKPPQSGTIRGKRCVNCCLCVYTNVYNQIQHVIKFCNWSCFKILDNVKFSDVRGLRAHQRLRFGAVNPLLLRTLAWMKVQCSYAHDSQLIVIFSLGPTNHHRDWHVATLVNLSKSIHPSIFKIFSWRRWSTTPWKVRTCSSIWSKASWPQGLVRISRGQRCFFFSIKKKGLRRPRSYFDGFFEKSCGEDACNPVQ